MTKIGFLIPEFPGQTHAFFMRERVELANQGVEGILISTQPPIAGSGNANHSWAAASAEETTYLYPLSLISFFKCISTIVAAGPTCWWSCLRVFFGESDLSSKDRIKLSPLMLLGAQLKRVSRLENFKHVHVHSCANSANIALFSKLLGGPTYSLTLHGPLQDYGPNQAAKWGHARFGIIITHELMDEILTTLHGVDLPPLSIAPMGVNVDIFKRTRPYQCCQPGESIQLVSCGRLNFVKAHDDLIRAVALLKSGGVNAKLHICGATDSLSETEDYALVLQNLCQELNVTEQVELLGSVSEERVMEELNAAHLFCLASLKEPLGVAIMEAMAMELPSIVAISPGVEELVDTEVDGILVSPRSPEQFAAAILRVANDPDLARRLGASGREKIARDFHSGISATVIAEACSSS